MHLDVHVAAGAAPQERRAVVAASVQRAVAMGATRVREVDEPTGDCVVVLDPEGDEFCLR
ncbi:hypothetical protein HDA32_003629 [Spinactinospora alkalitolerans]|uniref:Glyoxalase-like domain-containing protein n=1 Tax=Spinactinospora alkalitolerans TaxID=687207 RepID=A0A852TWW5_9ACTN|nr:hypothetical protein [Spinactinospora alkalitolerans]